MRLSASVLLLLAFFVGSASARRHEVHVRVLTALSGTLGGVAVGGLVGGEFTTQVPCSRPYPNDTVSVIPGGGVLDQCVLRNPAQTGGGTVQNRRVEALLTIEDGRRYYVVLGCQKQFGWCFPLTEQANYVGMLNDKPKWLGDYENRPFNGFIKVSFRLDGNKKVSYEIQYAKEVSPSSL
jgi:hypothetical protein